MKNDWGSLPNIIGSTGFVIGGCPEVFLPHRRFRRAQIALFAALAAPVVSMSFASASQAQVSRPDAGQILRETPPPPPPVPGEARSFAPEDRSTGRAKTFDAGRIVQFEFLLKAFLFTGNELVGEEELRREVPAIEALQGKRVSLADLEAVAEAITRYYRSRGYLVAIAYVPPQDVVDGIATVAINVLEGKVDHSRIGESAGYSPEVLQRFLDQSLCGRATPDCAGAPMQRAPIDRAIGIIADLPGVNSVGGTLSPGGPVGTSDLTFDASADPDRVWTLGADNFGNRYIGRDRVSAGVRMNNPSGTGDRLIADLITSGRGMSNGYLEYSLPIGYAGWRTGLSATHSVYKLGAPFDVTDSHGKADILSPFLAYQRRWRVRAGGEHFDRLPADPTDGGTGRGEHHTKDGDGDGVDQCIEQGL